MIKILKKLKVKKIDYQREIDNLDVNSQFILTEMKLLPKFIETLNFIKEDLQLETDIEPLKSELRTWEKELDKWRETNER